MLGGDETKTKNVSQNRRGLAHFAESSEQNVPVPLSEHGFWIVLGRENAEFISWPREIARSAAHGDP